MFHPVPFGALCRGLYSVESSPRVYDIRVWLVTGYAHPSKRNVSRINVGQIVLDSKQDLLWLVHWSSTNRNDHIVMIRNVEFKTRNDTIQFTTGNGTFLPPENGAVFPFEWRIRQEPRCLFGFHDVVAIAIRTFLSFVRIINRDNDCAIEELCLVGPALLLLDSPWLDNRMRRLKNCSVMSV